MGWLYQGEERRIPRSVKERLESEPLATSAIVELELTYLHEIGRVTEPAATVLTALRRGIGLEIVDVPTTELVRVATDLSWTRDPFDRLIAAQAIVDNAPLVTADQKILENLPLAIWD